MGKERIATSVKRVRSVFELEKVVQEYFDKSEWIHPPRRSEQFTKNSYEKWACKELLKEIRGYLKDVYDLPFSLSAYELLYAFADKMKSYACEHPDKAHTDCFLYAAELADYFMESC